MISKNSSQYIPNNTILNPPKQHFKIPTRIPSLLRLNQWIPSSLLRKNPIFISKKESSDSISTREDSSDEETMINCSISILDILSRKFDISN